MKYDHALLMKIEPEYKALHDFIEDNQPVDEYDKRLDRWGPMIYRNINGPLCIAEVFTKSIINDGGQFILMECRP